MQVKVHNSLFATVRQQNRNIIEIYIWTNEKKMKRKEIVMSTTGQTRSKDNAALR